MNTRPLFKLVKDTCLLVNRMSINMDMYVGVLIFHPVNQCNGYIYMCV